LTAYHCANSLCNGFVVAIDRSKAAHEFKRSGDQGNSMAQCYYGLCLHEGSGVVKNQSKAAQYLNLSTDQGEVHS
jgi:TPR repeat protein